MPKDKGKAVEETPVEKTVEDAGASADAAATPVAPEASADAGDDSSASGIISEAEAVAEETLAEVREELSRAEQAVMDWVNAHFSNSPISRATEALNYLREHAVPDLLNRIKEI
jgi:hypothetical protein